MWPAYLSALQCSRAGGPNRGQTKRGPYDDGPVIDVSAERID